MMGNCFSHFRAVFKPNAGSDSSPLKPIRAVPLKPPDGLPRPMRASERSAAYEVDGSAAPDVLVVKEVDLCLSLNGKEHHTEQYHAIRRENRPQLVVRRGQQFQMDLVLSRAFNSNLDAISFIFTCANTKKPNHGQGTLVAVPLLVKSAPSVDSWTATIDRSSENVISVQITPAANCIVGEWKMDIDTKLMDNSALSFNLDAPFYVLFNPWCQDDQVYIDGEELRREYVLADTGLIWRGTLNRMRPSVWKFAQFEKDILECSVYLLTNTGKLPPSSCNDPVKITRALSAAVNSPDDYGVVMGNWSADFGGGTPPSKWVGSMKIIQKFFKDKKPVKYGQCWVFAGIVCTVCRALGIPCRVITTYAAAHDTQNSLTVDYFVDENGSVMEELNSDSIWNFHVWNEVWASRHDLGEDDKYGGWQVVDATPQELSDDMFRLGPTSVTAVKNAEILRPYDTAFVFSEVNADKIFWRYAGPSQPLKLLRKDMLGIGQCISTKAVGKWTREDITENYKHAEKTETERTNMLKALRQSESLFSRYYLNEEFNDIKFDFKLLDDIVIGLPFSVILSMKNKSRTKDYSISIILRVDTVIYTGKIKDSVKKEKFEIVVKAGAEEEVKMDVSWEEYSKRLVDQCAFNIASMATVNDTNFEYFAQDDFRVRKPDIKIKLDGEALIGQPLTGTVSFINPLPVSLKKGKFVIEGPGLEAQYKVKLTGNVGPNEELSAPFKMIPMFPGRATIVVKFTSKELDDVDGFLNFMVHDKPSELNGVSNNI
ncbi:hypothetical protein LSTR_LSTR002827 [Laodelphax striatellus]|uniref:protein-glutamine gamma-glutamyltransferase n=1 Tax=Laodelphax striatellus TaxID=195883 RepID=A0A482XI95_LAOST|nr:hypothetical protein LSTR_LSTR002827 [Laodelphax striatellus]